MDENVTEDQLVEAAKALGKEEFSRSELAEAMGVKTREFKESFRAARDSGRLERIGKDEEGTNLFRVIHD